MAFIRSRLKFFLTGTGIVVLIALAVFALHMLTNHNYGFHRDELSTVDSARFLDWGYVDYPPMTPFLARIGLDVFGLSPTGIRLFAALAQSVVIVLAGLMTRELGGGGKAQILAAVAAGTAPFAILMGAVLLYSSIDMVWWALTAYLLIRLLKSDDPRWWLGIGAAIGLGMMTKYTMGLCVIGLGLGIVLTPARKYLKSPWLYAGAGVAVLICLPNLIWQAQHNFISLAFLSSIHARDIGEGRTDNFLLGQLYQNANAFALPIWIAGLAFYFFRDDGRPYRALGWIWLISFVILAATLGRSYYLASAYPMLLSAGAVVWERWLASLSAGWARSVEGVTWAGVGIAAALFGMVSLPLAPINSGLWKLDARIHDLFTEQIGWQELTRTVADIYHNLPPEDRARAAILAGNYGEAGAIDLYGKAYGLPDVIAGVNTYWYRGYPNPPPLVVIVVGWSQSDVAHATADCTLAGHNGNPYGVINEESRDHPDIFVCRNLRVNWPEFWKTLQYFG